MNNISRIISICTTPVVIGYTVFCCSLKSKAGRTGGCPNEDSEFTTPTVYVSLNLYDSINAIRPALVLCHQSFPKNILFGDAGCSLKKINQKSVWCSWHMELVVKVWDIVKMYRCTIP